MATEETILRVEDLQTHFFTRSGVVKAVDGISFDLHRGETLGIVGESGSGKSMTAWSILGLVPQPAGRIVGGKILYQGENLLEKGTAEMREIRGKGICMVMQDPSTSLNPVFTIGNQVYETLRMDSRQSRSSLKQRAVEILSSVRIPAPERRLASFPHQMSGGMRQRVVGAIAMSRGPNVLIADEPTTSLDATIQLQYLMLLKEIQAQTGAAIIFITPRLRHCRPDVRPGGRHVRWQDCRAGRCAAALRQSLASLHGGTAPLRSRLGRPDGIPPVH